MKLKVHKEPKDFNCLPAEQCVVCGKPTRTFLTPHIPLCKKCCEDENKASKKIIWLTKK